MKGRYAPLSEVVSRVGCTKVLAQSSELKSDCVQCLSVHALTTCGAELYKAMGLSLKAEWGEHICDTMCVPPAPRACMPPHCVRHQSTASIVRLLICSFFLYDSSLFFFFFIT